MPPEWAVHARCWMAWPVREASWGSGSKDARLAYAEVAQAIARFEPVTMIVQPEFVATASLYCGPGITVLPMEHDDSWVRDTGPCFLTGTSGELAGVAWTFNGWGEARPDYARDARVAGRILDHVGARRYAGGLVLEGGAVQVDGDGTCIAATGAILDPKRNPGCSREEAEAKLCAALGVTAVIWLPAGLGSTVADVARFARPGAVLALSSDDKADADYSRLAENLDVLRAATDARGRSLEVLPVAQPKARQGRDGQCPPVSHLSFYLANGALIVPRFGDGTDSSAAKILTTAWPERELVPVDALAIVAGGGGIHAITLGQPAV